MAINEQIVTGEIIFGEEAKTNSGVTIYIRLEDISIADTASKLIAEQVLSNVSFQAGHRIKFLINLHGKALNERASYSLRVHVDVDGDGQISRGDYISMVSYPVLTFGYPNHATIQVREV